MQVAFHMGASFTDEDALLRSVRQSSEALHALGIEVPAPAGYRTLIRDALRIAENKALAANAHDVFLDALATGEDTRRLVLSNHNFIAIPRRIFADGTFYGQLEAKLQGVQQLFASDRLELFLAVRHPAAFLSAAWEKAEAASLSDFLNGAHPLDIEWHTLVARIRAAAPEVGLTVWCHEDLPLVWEEVLTAMTGISHPSQRHSALAFLSNLITPEGLTAVEAVLSDEPEMSLDAFQRLCDSALSDFARPQALSQQITLPGISQCILAEMDRGYQDDLDQIAAMPGVRYIAPAY